MLRRVPTIYASSCEIHDCFRSLNRLPPIVERFAVPMELPNRAPFAMRAAAQDHDFVASCEQGFGERLPEKSAAAGENNARFHNRASGKRQAPLSHDRREAISR